MCYRCVFCFIDYNCIIIFKSNQIKNYLFTHTNKFIVYIRAIVFVCHDKGNVFCTINSPVYVYWKQQTISLLMLCLIKLFSISEYLHFILNSLASCMAFSMVLLHLLYSEVECDSFICAFSLQHLSRSVSMPSVIHGFFLLRHFPRTSVAVSLIAVLNMLVSLSTITLCTSVYVR